MEPFYPSALGGDTWGLYYDADAEAVTSVNGVGPAGSGATLADYGPQAGTPGLHQVVVPDAWDGWMVWLGEYGTMDLDEVLAPLEISPDGLSAEAAAEPCNDTASGIVTPPG